MDQPIQIYLRDLISLIYPYVLKNVDIVVQMEWDDMNHLFSEKEETLT